MFEKGLAELEAMSRHVGNSPDIVQGGGGNTSVKLDGELMAIKASGYMLKQVTAREGFAVVNYKNIRDYYEKGDLKPGADYEKESAEFVRKNTVKLEGIKELRPSVEAGFHSIMRTYVIHTHSAYANILCCSGEGKGLLEKIFAGKDYGILWAPYVNPGFYLTLEIMKGAQRQKETLKDFPEAVFMENHGLIVNSDSFERCIRLNDEINSSIKKYFGIKDAYPEIILDKQDDCMFVSKTGYLAEFFRNSGIDAGFFERNALYPDQLVYLNGNISVNGGDKKLNIDTSSGTLTYKTHLAEARTMEETLLAYIYVISKIREYGLTLKTMSEKEIGFIAGWEGEKYRKSMISGKTG